MEWVESLLSHDLRRRNYSLLPIVHQLMTTGMEQARACGSSSKGGLLGFTTSSALNVASQQPPVFHLAAHPDILWKSSQCHISDMPSPPLPEMLISSGFLYVSWSRGGSLTEYDS